MQDSEYMKKARAIMTGGSKVRKLAPNPDLNSKVLDKAVQDVSDLGDKHRKALSLSRIRNAMK